MSTKAMLQDNTRCIGCRGCQAACKAWNDLPGVETTFFVGPGYRNPRDLNANTWTLVTYTPAEAEGRFDWAFGRLLCMHCQEPACAAACPVGALEKTDLGPVVYHSGKCIGCRYCMLACPFQVPTFEWSKALPLVRKCTMCFDRITNGELPACAKTCPAQAITFGDRDALVAEAWERIERNPSGYIHHVYGEKEIGGTSVLTLSSVPFEKLGLRTDLGEKPLPRLTHAAMQAIPAVMVGVGIVMGATYGLMKRRMALQAPSEDLDPIEHANVPGKETEDE